MLKKNCCNMLIKISNQANLLILNKTGYQKCSYKILYVQTVLDCLYKSFKYLVYNTQLFLICNIIFSEF